MKITNLYQNYTPEPGLGAKDHSYHRSGSKQQFDFFRISRKVISR